MLTRARIFAVTPAIEVFLYICKVNQNKLPIT